MRHGNGRVNFHLPLVYESVQSHVLCVQSFFVQFVHYSEHFRSFCAPAHLRNFLELSFYQTVFPPRHCHCYEFNSSGSNPSSESSNSSLWKYFERLCFLNYLVHCSVRYFVQLKYFVRSVHFLDGYFSMYFFVFYSTVVCYFALVRYFAAAARHSSKHNLTFNGFKCYLRFCEAVVQVFHLGHSHVNVIFAVLPLVQFLSPPSRPLWSYSVDTLEFLQNWWQIGSEKGKALTNPSSENSNSSIWTLFERNTKPTLFSCFLNYLVQNRSVRYFLQLKYFVHSAHFVDGYDFTYFFVFYSTVVCYFALVRYFAAADRLDLHYSKDHKLIVNGFKCYLRFCEAGVQVFHLGHSDVNVIFSFLPSPVPFLFPLSRPLLTSFGISASWSHSVDTLELLQNWWQIGFGKGKALRILCSLWKGLHAFHGQMFLVRPLCWRLKLEDDNVFSHHKYDIIGAHWYRSGCCQIDLFGAFHSHQRWIQLGTALRSLFSFVDLRSLLRPWRSFEKRSAVALGKRTMLLVQRRWLIKECFCELCDRSRRCLSGKMRNKLMHMLCGNRRFVNVNICGKGISTIKKILSQLDPDVLVVTEPGSLGARPRVRGFHMVRHKNIAVLLREKTTTFVSDEILWTKRREVTEEPEPQEDLTDLTGKKKVRFAEFVETKTDRTVERSKLVEKDKSQMPDVRIFKTTFRMSGVQWNLLAVYGPQKDDASRKDFWRKLDEILLREGESLKNPTCVAGDFNALASPGEATGLTSAGALVVPQLQKWEDEKRLWDIWNTQPPSLGVTRFKPDGSGGSRLDRFLANTRALKVIKRSWIRVGEQVSDHAMLLWDFTMVSENEWRKVVNANNAQLNAEKWTEKIARAWNEWVTEQPFVKETVDRPANERIALFQAFWWACRGKLYDLIGVGLHIKRMSKRLAKASRADDTIRKAGIVNKMKEDLKKRLLRKKKGEGNREVFALKNETGKWLEGTELESFVAKELRTFGHRRTSHTEAADKRTPLTKEEQEEIVQTPDFREFLAVLKKMKKRKACLKEDLPGWLLKESDEKMQRVCFELICLIWEKPEAVPDEWKKTVVRLIPKAEKDLSMLASWRPIAIGTTLNKIVMAIWKSRLEKMALKKQWLHPNQFGFIQNRTAKGAADMARCHVDSLKRPVVLQWDIERAFPSLSPCLVAEMLKKLNVPHQFCDLFLAFYTNSSSEAIIAGVPGGNTGKCSWKNEWGLKQGCPASPLLLNLWTFPIVEFLASKMRFLQYADDMWAFVEDEEENTVKKMLPELVDAIGLVVNGEKAKRWTPSSPECLSVLGMVVREGKREKLADKVDKVLSNGILRGVERELTGWQKVAYLNSVVLPRVRYVLGAFWSKRVFQEAKETDEVVRAYVKREWPIYTDNAFLYDESIGLGLKSLEEEVAKDVVCYVWNLQAQGVEISALWKKAWMDFKVGVEDARILQWKTAVELLTDLEVEPGMYRAGKKNPFPLEQTGHLHKAPVQQTFVCPPRDLFVQHKCEEAWESIHNINALRVWSDASVTETRAAAAVLVEGREGKPNLVGRPPPSKWKDPVMQKVTELGLNLNICDVDEDYSGKVRGSCALCGKSFEALIRNFLSRGLGRCDCVPKASLEDAVRKKATEFGVVLVHIDDDRQGKVKGACRKCHKPFEVFIRSFLYRGPTKCECSQSRKTETKDDDVKPPEVAVTAPPSRRNADCAIPAEIFYFPTRGDSFRSESLGLLGAKRILIARGNLEGNEELHFLCDNKANIDLLQRMQKDEFVPKNLIFREHQQLERELLSMWKTIRYIFVKGHVGVPQNELCDVKAKLEADRCTEAIAEEVLEAFGDIKNKGKIVESRKELEKRMHWMNSYHLGTMAVCRSRLAKRVQIGIEKWSGNLSIFQEETDSLCKWCETLHEKNFYDSIRKCPMAREFREEVKTRWKKVIGGEAFDPDLWFGKVKKTLFKRVCQKVRDQKEVWRNFRRLLRWWERKLQDLRNRIGAELKEKAEEEECKEVEDEEEKEKQLARSIRVMDVGTVKPGEPEIFFSASGKQELKKFLLSDRWKPVQQCD